MTRERKHRVNPELSKLSEKARNLPLQPGVYLMYDEKGTIIYVGKAKKLRNRVSSYFCGEHLPKVEAMVDKVRNFETIIVNSEFEALVLENSLIKKHKPHYNILLKDDKGYPFIRINLNDPYPRLSLSANSKKDGAEYYGPFGSRGQTNSIIRSINGALQLNSCAKKFPRDIGKERPCLNRDLGLCAGWCTGQPDAACYRERISCAVALLEGKGRKLTEELKSRMEEAAERLEFEQAAELRDRMRGIELLNEKQRVISTPYSDTDVIGFSRSSVCAVSIIHYCGGNVADKETIILRDPLEDDAEMLSEIIRQLYENRGPKVRKDVLLPLEPSDIEELERYLNSGDGARLRLFVPQRGEKLRLVRTAVANAADEAERAVDKLKKTKSSLEWLEKALRLPACPKRIEAFDISNLKDSGIVAGMTCFVDGAPSRADYKRFRIKSIETQDDYAAMQEAVLRRFSEYRAGTEGFEVLPDLLLIDGGAGQVGAAIEALDSLGICIPVFGMVKDSRHRTRALTNPEGEESDIQCRQDVFSLIGRIQEETHRFAVTYQRKTRNENLKTELEKIKGVGPQTAKKLLSSFSGAEAIRKAELADLKMYVPANAAAAVYNYYHGQERK